MARATPKDVLRFCVIVIGVLSFDCYYLVYMHIYKEKARKSERTNLESNIVCFLNSKSQVIHVFREDKNELLLYDKLLQCIAQVQLRIQDV